MCVYVYVCICVCVSGLVDCRSPNNIFFHSIVIYTQKIGIGYHMPIEHHNLGDARRLFDVNFFGNLALVQAFLPIVREDKARIVFISSLAGRITQPKEGIYSASKSAVESLADALRQELYPHSVSVSLVEPGIM